MNTYIINLMFLFYHNINETTYTHKRTRTHTHTHELTCADPEVFLFHHRGRNGGALCVNGVETGSSAGSMIREHVQNAM